jgi:E3 ubiquitin-protein ligase AIP2
MEKEAGSTSDGESLRALVEALQKQLQKKQTFETATSALTGLVQHRYATAVPSDQALLYTAVCRAATVLTTRFTAPGFWKSGLHLFESTAAVVKQPEQRKKMLSFVQQAHAFLGEKPSEQEEDNLPATMRAGTSSGFLFEGQLTVDSEPPPPHWLQAQNAFASLISRGRNFPEMETQPAAAAAAATSVPAVPARETDQDGVEEDIPETTEEIAGQQLRDEIQAIINRVNASQVLDGEFVGLEEAIQATLEDAASVPRGAPPASKEAVAKLPIREVTQADLLSSRGEDQVTECAVCREAMAVGDKMQVMPCKHDFHVDCLKPWLDEHNSCPVCRYQMRTDDEEYEDNKAYENALRGGEFMYI